MSNTERRVSVEDGKYTFIIKSDDYRVRVLRHGQEWLTIEQGSGAIWSLVCESHRDQPLVEAVRKWVNPDLLPNPGKHGELYEAFRAYCEERGETPPSPAQAIKDSLDTDILRDDYPQELVEDELQAVGCDPAELVARNRPKVDALLAKRKAAQDEIEPHGRELVEAAHGIAHPGRAPNIRELDRLFAAAEAYARRESPTTDPTCPGCHNAIQPDVCHCGTPSNDHTIDDGHHPVPMGCDCGRAEDGDEAAL